MLLFVLVATALAWMHVAIRRMERRHFPQIDRETDLPEAIDAAAADRARGRKRCRSACARVVPAAGRQEPADAPRLISIRALRRGTPANVRHELPRRCK